jgi:hypothetical protein
MNYLPHAELAGAGNGISRQSAMRNERDPACLKNDPPARWFAA